MTGINIAYDHSPHIDFIGPNIAVDRRAGRNNDITLGFDVAGDGAVNMDPASTLNIPLYFCAGRDDTGMACEAMWLSSAMKDSHGTPLIFLKIER